MGKIFGVEFQIYPLKFHTKYFDFCPYIETCVGDWVVRIEELLDLWIYQHFLKVQNDALVQECSIFQVIQFQENNF